MGTQRARVLDSANREIPCQFLRPRKFTPRGSSTTSGRPPAGAASAAGLPAYGPGESLNAASIVFRAKAPAMGYGSYRIEPVYDNAPLAVTPGATASTEADGTVVLETDLYRVRIDPSRGGTISSLIARDGNREIVDTAGERRFNEYRGYFISEQKWASSADNRATVAITERGPVRVKVQVSGQILGRRFQTTIALAQGQRRIDLPTTRTPGSAIRGTSSRKTAVWSGAAPKTTAASNCRRFSRCRSATRPSTRTPPTTSAAAATRTPTSRSGTRSSTTSSFTGWT